MGVWVLAGNVCVCVCYVIIVSGQNLFTQSHYGELPPIWGHFNFNCGLPGHEYKILYRNASNLEQSFGALRFEL